MGHIRKVREILVRLLALKDMEHTRDEHAVLMRTPFLEDRCVSGKSVEINSKNICCNK
jgi:hypothetical protein